VVPGRQVDRPIVYLIDASSYVFRAFHAIPALSTAAGLPTNAVYGVATMLLKLRREAAPQYAMAVFDAPGETFRDRMYADYKAHRPPAPDELRAQLPAVRRIVSTLGFATREEPGVEADDVIGTLARRGVESGAAVVIVTGDKDMLQLVGEHVSLWDTMRDRRTTLEDVRDRFGLEPAQLVDVMALMGDASDNIPGVAGVGEKTAVALIRHFGTLEAALACADADGLARAGVRGAAKVAAALRRGGEAARMSRELVRVRCDLPLEFSLGTCRYTGPDTGALRPLLAELEFFSLLRETAPEGGGRPCPEVASERLETPEALAAFVAAAERAERVAVVAAWSVPRPMQADIAGLALATAPTEVARVDPTRALDGGAILRLVAPLLESATVEKVGDELKGLGVVTGRQGIRLSGRLFDSTVADYVLDPTREGHGVAALAERFLGRAVGEDLAARAAALLELRPLLAEQLEAHDAGRLFSEVEMPLVAVLAAMERHGVLVDVARLEALSREYASRLERLMEEIHALAGGAFNIHSPPQLRAVLFDRLGLSARGVRRGKTGLSTDVDVLTRLAREHPLPGKILEYRTLAKLRSTYVDALPALVDPRTGRIHTSFHQTVTATGRLSSSEPNLQNIPIRGEEGRRIRDAFRPAPGRVLLSADYSQIELRILAHLSRDPVLIEAFRRGEDIHARTAAEVFGGLAGGTAEARRAAKAINFGILYGMGAARLARELDIGPEEATRYIRRYFQRYPGVRAFIDRTVEEARSRGYVTTLLNRRRYLPEIGAGEGALRQFAERTAVNTPIQGSAADLIKMAMLRVDERLGRERLDAFMVLQVHDELLFEVGREAAPIVAAAVAETMEGVMDLDVPLRVAVRTGESWAEAH
jgi:DNA polymerase-1